MSDRSIDVAELACLIPLPHSPVLEPESPLDMLGESSHTGNKSGTSTLEYDHERFGIFQFRVIALARFILWPGVKPDLIFVEHMNGGGHNRIIALNRDKERYIVRVPRYQNLADMSRDVAAAQFCRRFTCIPIPEVIAFDETSANPLRSPYMVQNRLPGGSAFSQYPSLGHEQKCILALEMGRVYREMTKAQSHNAGYLVFPSGEWSIQIHVAPFQPKDSHESWLYRCRDPTIPAKDLMLSLFRAQTDHRNKVARTIDVEVFQIMAEELAEDGWLDNIPNCLSHLDLFPHNILIHHDAAPHMPVLSAILDWDSAVLAPVFMCCVPPMWIWVWIGDEQEDEFRANDEPITAENQVLKHIFEIAAGPVYMRFAYETPYRLARRLMTFAIETRDSAYEVRDTIVMCEEWIVFTRNRGKHSKLISFTPFNDLKKVLRLRGL